MRTRELFRYLVAMIIALSTTVNAMAQERNLKIYFDEYADGKTAPKMLMTDDNDSYGLPDGLSASVEGVAWAGKSRFFEWVTTNVTDRVMADYVVDKNGNVDKKNSHLKLKFTDFPYEVNVIQWNVMNDLLSGSVTNFFKNYGVTTKCTPVSGNGFSYTEEHWSMNIFSHQVTFSQGDIPWKEGAVLNGLTSFEISEYYETKVGIGSWTWWDLGQSELNDKNRTFIKAGWNGLGQNNGSNISDSDDSNWAFKVKFTLPEIRMTSYACDFVNGNVKLGQPDNYIYKGERVVHALRGYISAHAGAVEPTYDPADIDGFHFEYFADDNQMDIVSTTGLIKEAKVAGEIPVTVVLMRGPNREVCRYVQKIRVYEKVINATSPEICIGFVDGKKGYDLTLTEKNAQIKGFITKYGKDQNNNDVIINPIENAGGYHFEYSESSNGKIITIDPITGNITPKAEGDVTITAVLKDGNTVISNPYSYTLHVFGKAEGVDVTKHESSKSDKEIKYIYSDASNQYEYSYTEYVGWPISIPIERTGYKDRDTWKASETYNSSSASYDWKHNKYLRPGTTILENGSSQSGESQDGWKEIAWYNTTSANYWRGVAQKIGFDLRMPKYSTMKVKFSFAGNVNIGTAKGTNCKYGFEVIDLGHIQNDKPETSNAAFNSITWKTNGTGENVSSSSNSSYTTLAQKGAAGNGGYVGDGISNIDWSYNKTTESDFGSHRYYTHYVAVMAYLYRDGSYPGEFSVGYKGIPTYTYYTKVTYAKNDGTGTILRPEPEKWETTTSKTETFKLFQGASNSEKAQLSSRIGYTFLGWSTDPNATTPEYGLEDDFPIYDNVNGGGKGHVTLYAVWKPNTYIVALRRNSKDDSPVDGYVYAIYDQNMPLVDVDGNAVKAPITRGYDFKGYYGEKLGGGNIYYNEDMSSNHIWDRTDKNYVIAKWDVHKSTVVFDPQGGNNYGATRVTATYYAAMPTEGVQAPQRQGYTFGGYYSKPNGAGTQYYTASMTSARTWNIDERLLDPPTTEVTLYAKWIGNTYAVTLDPQGGTGGTTSVTATYGQPLPSGLTAPTKPGYEFRGYYSNANDEWPESQGQDIYYGGKEYYDKDMNGVEPWDKTEATTIYAHWAPATYIVTLDANGGVLPNNVIEKNESNFDIAIPEGSNGVITITYKYKTGKSNTLVHAEAKKPGYELLGWFVGDVKVIDASETSRNCVITDNGGYWTENGLKYNHAGDLTLTAQYRKKYKYADNVITFGKDENGNPEKVEPDQDWLYSVVNDLVGAAKDVYDHEAGHPQTMVFDLRESVNRWSGNYDCQLVMEDLMKSEYSEFISPNVLVYFNNDSYNADKCNNAILSDYTCPNLYVADRYQMKIPYAFDAGKATYERNKLQIDTDDPMWQQSHKSIWGTLCLPYPIKNNNTYKDVSKVIFYELRKHSGSVMQYYKLPEDAVIPANTPVLYERTVGISSAVTIEENAKDINDKRTWIQVPENPDITAVVKSYADAPEPSIHDWEFRGNLKTRVFYGANYVGTPEEADAEIVNNGDIYYFKENKFTHLTPAMTKNGTFYNAGKMTIYPYRAYFYKKGTGGSAKIASYSILVVDEFGNTTDITNAVFGDGEGDGKIYDLNGIRVMQPVKGRLYIVNGQKKVYR